MRTKVAILVLSLVGCHGARHPPCALDPALTAEDCAALQATVLPETLVASHGNAHADNLDAAQLGFKIFFDARFSSNLQVRCATCHRPEANFDDELQTARAIATGPRNTPSLLNAAWFRWEFWDGRADSLWSQPLFALENPIEMNFTRLEIAHLVGNLYPAPYQQAFGTTFPDISDLTRFPPKGAPGDVAFDQMAGADKQVIHEIVANVGKALEAYVRKLAAGRSAVDQFILGNQNAISPTARRGLVVFAKSGCLGCHSGPLFSDEQFHNLGVSTDPGRSRGLAILLASPFNAFGSFYEGTPPPYSDGYQAGPEAVGAFKTSSLRNVSKTAPYGHDGSFATLQDAIGFHLQPPAAAPVGQLDPLAKPQSLSADDQAALIEFLKALDGAYPPPPWNNWPQG